MKIFEPKGDAKYTIGVDFAEGGSDWSYHSLLRGDPDGTVTLLHDGKGTGGHLVEIETASGSRDKSFTITCEECLKALDGHADVSVVMEKNW
jgi:hypothetical protein